jgi:hypothetical protein
MKNYVLALAFSAISLSVFATTDPSASSSSKSTRIPHYYVMMKRGKLIEVSHGHQKSVKKDITLANETTIHPNGSVDEGSGKSLHIKEGQYITMDGKIRNLRDMGRK